MQCFPTDKQTDSHEFLFTNKMKEVMETVADSIAIEILNENNILTGRGNQLFLYSKSLGHKDAAAEEVRVNEQLENKIHGICKGSGCNRGKLLVYGEKEFILLEYAESEAIHSQRFLIKPAFFRAHLSDWISSGTFINDGQQLILCTAHSIVLRFDYNVDKGSCVLTERIKSGDKSTLYCAHVYGDTWSDLIVLAGNAFGELLIWQPSQADASTKCVGLIHRISAHNGVIFSIDYDMKSQQLITTSDDRAVKWWKVKFPKDKLNSWSTTSLQAVASGYGHVARVFKGRIIRKGGQTYALSVGEDSYFCLWTNNGELLYKRRQQYGAVIWNFAYDERTKTIYTIGSLGNLIAYGLKHILQENQTNNDSLQLLPQISTEKPSEYIAKVKFLSVTENVVICLTNENRLMWYTISSKTINDLEEWKDSGISITFKCTTMEVSEERIAICGFKRMLLIDWNSKTCKFERIKEMDVLHGVIRTFVFFSKDNYLVCDDKGNCRLFSPVWHERYLQLPKCKEPWITAALLLNNDKSLIISNRQGNHSFYEILEDESCYRLIDTIKHPHGNLGATKLQQLHDLGHGSYIRSVGHDGGVNVFSVSYGLPSSITFGNREIIPVSWVEHIEQRVGNKSDLFLGFNDNHFVVWSREYDFLLQLPCGGGHRCWDYKIDSKLNEISLVFVKNKRLRFYTLPLYNKEQLAMPPAKRWHIASCNKMVTLNDTIAVTAGDDNLIKIHQISDLGLVLKKELFHHISNVRALQVVDINALDFLIFSGGGRAQLCITKVSKCDLYAQELINYSLEKSESGRKIQSNTSYNFDPETRIMSLATNCVSENIYHIVAGCSDGYIRLLAFDIVKLEVTHLKKYFYNKCILQVEYVLEGQAILTAATDGKIKIFDAELNECLHELQHHSSGVNGLATHFDKRKNTLKMLSGGDDQAVSYTELCTKTYNVLNRFHKAFLHTAQVCASAISSDGRYGYTSGVDQNVYKLDLAAADGGNVVSSFHSCVADIKGISLVKGNNCLIYGCGLQFIEDL